MIQIRFVKYFFAFENEALFLYDHFQFKSERDLLYADLLSYLIIDIKLSNEFYYIIKSRLHGDFEVGRSTFIVINCCLKIRPEKSVIKLKQFHNFHKSSNHRIMSIHIVI